MRLTDHTDYALRVLMHLNQAGRPQTLEHLARSLRVSRNNLIKVSNQLAKANLVETTRGRGGGLCIRPEAGQKTLREIVTLTEGRFALAECFRDAPGDCTFLRVCRLKKALTRALEAFLGSLGEATLNDVTPLRGFANPDSCRPLKS